MARPDSIRKIGLKRHIDGQVEARNGFDYENFCKMVEANVSVASMARAFKVTVNTMNKWLQIHREETRERTNSKATAKSQLRQSRKVSGPKKRVQKGSGLETARGQASGRRHRRSRTAASNRKQENKK